MKSEGMLAVKIIEIDRQQLLRLVWTMKIGVNFEIFEP